MRSTNVVNACGTSARGPGRLPNDAARASTAWRSAGSVAAPRVGPSTASVSPRVNAAYRFASGGIVPGELSRLDYVALVLLVLVNADARGVVALDGPALQLVEEM